MDMLILLALFIAILALAYFTYRNLVGLDGRLRKIENILQNAEVVTTSDPAAMPSAQSQTHAHSHGHAHGHSQGAEYSSAFVSPEYIAGWGGQGPVLTVQKEGEGEESEEKVVELVDELEEGEEIEEVDDAHSDTDSESAESEAHSEEDDAVLNLDLDETEVSKNKVEDSIDDILTAMENDSRRRLAETGSGGPVGPGNESVSRGPKVTEMKDALKKAGVSFPATAKKSDLQKLMEEHHIQV